MLMVKRDSFFDALKGVLIFLVVLGHMLELNAVEDPDFPAPSRVVIGRIRPIVG